MRVNQSTTPAGSRRHKLAVNAAWATVVILAASTGVAYGANEYTGANIQDGTIGSVDITDNNLGAIDIAAGAVGNSEVATNAITSDKVVNGTLWSADIKNQSITALDLAPNSVGLSELLLGSVNSEKVLDGSLTGADIAPGAIGSDQVQDFGLSNQDVGVLFAQIDADSTVANSSGGVTGSKLGTGVYSIDFGRDISACGFTATQGEAGVGGASGAVMGVTDRSGNVNAIFVTARVPNTNVLADTAFQLMVVC